MSTKLYMIFFICFLNACYFGYGKKSATKEKLGREGKAVSLKKPAASAFLSFKECMQKMNCGPALRKECAEECEEGNTKEEIEEHTERLKNIEKYVKDAKDKKKMEQRQDTDLSDDDSTTTDSDTDSDDEADDGKGKKKHYISSRRAASFLSYNECMRRMNCGPSLRKECSEECKEGNTEEEAEEHGSLLRNIDKYVAEAKRRKALNDLESSDTDTSTDDTDTTTDADDDTDTDDSDTDSDAESDECKKIEKKSKTCKKRN